MRKETHSALTLLTEQDALFGQKSVSSVLPADGCHSDIDAASLVVVH